MIISQCKKEDFTALSVVNSEKNVFDIRWGREDVVEKVGKIDEETGQWVLTGETRETNLCTYEIHRFFGSPLTTHVLDKVFKSGQRLPKVKELRAIGTAIGMTDEQMLPWVKEYLRLAVAKYDKSNSVEDFTINGIHLWLDSTMRNKVKENLEYCQTMGIENTTLRYEGMAFPMTVAMGWQLYYAVLGYARDTWDVTQVHDASIPNLESMDAAEEFEAYFPTAYPPKLAF